MLIKEYESINQVVIANNQTAGSTSYSICSGIEPAIFISGWYFGGITYEKITVAPGVISFGYGAAAKRISDKHPGSGRRMD